MPQRLRSASCLNSTECSGLDDRRQADCTAATRGRSGFAALVCVLQVVAAGVLAVVEAERRRRICRSPQHATDATMPA
ncbi:MAG: hypothetical protein HY332_06195 [Chloroflexi bacterium]|nr:hypothetical protein [Chloroflexota bacterium]